MVSETSRGASQTPISAGGRSGARQRGEPRLEIEIRIGRLFGQDRLPRGDEAAAEHVVGGAVAALDADEPVAVKAAHREGAGSEVATHAAVLGAGGQSDHLELEVALVAPEPGQSGVDRRLAGNAGGDAAPLVDGVLHGFEADALAGRDVGERSVVAV